MVKLRESRNLVSTCGDGLQDCALSRSEVPSGRRSVASDVYFIADEAQGAF
jgi:hypothetical protein